MKKAKYIQLLLVIIVASTSSFVLAKFSYNKLDTRLQSKLFFKEDPFIIGDYNEQYFKFRQTVLNIVEEIRFSLDPMCNLDKIGNVMPISVLEDRDVFTLEIINLNKKDNVNCFENILNKIKLQFIKNIKKKMSQLNLQQSLRMQALDDLDSKKITLEAQRKDKKQEPGKTRYESKKINFSEFLRLLDNEQVLEIGITQDFIAGEMINGDKFYTVSKDVSSSDYLIETIYGKGIDFYFIDEDYSKNKVYREVYNRQTIEAQVQLSFFKNKLDQAPYIVINITHEDIKLSFKIYLLIILIVLNFFGIIIFGYYNRIYFKSVFKFLKKIA